MARYLTEEQARADGLEFGHELESHQFTVSRGERTLGVAHYSLSSDGSVIDFDHTEVIPELRGTGISAILATRALSDDIVNGRAVKTSCWFMDGYLAKHPELIEH